MPHRPAAQPAGDFDAEEGMSFETSKGVKVVNTFEAMKIRDPLLRGVYAFGFEKPSAIQQRAILPITQGGPRGFPSVLSLRSCSRYRGCRQQQRREPRQPQWWRWWQRQWR